MNTRARKQRLIADINITPFTDVILVLLVIFMITTPLILQANIKVNLPGAASASAGKTQNQMNIIINNRGMIYLDDTAVTREDLKKKVSDMRAKDPDLEVVLLSDRSVQFKEIVAVLDILNGLGVRHLNIATKAQPAMRAR